MTRKTQEQAIFYTTLFVALLFVAAWMAGCSMTPEAVAARDEADATYKAIHADGIVTQVEAEQYIAALQKVYDTEKQDKGSIDWTTLASSLLLGIPSTLLGVRAWRGPSTKNAPAVA